MEASPPMGLVISATLTQLSNEAPAVHTVKAKVAEFLTAAVILPPTMRFFT